MRRNAWMVSAALLAVVCAVAGCQGGGGRQAGEGGAAPARADAAVAATAVRARIEWRLASYTPRDGYAATTFRERTVYLAPQALSTVQGGASVARVDGDDGRPALDLRFAQPDPRLTQGTQEHVGTPLALLADAQVLSVATIMAPLPGDDQRLSGLQDAQEQQRLFDLLTKGAPASAAPAPEHAQ